MLLSIVSEQTLYKTRVDAMHVRRYAPRSHSRTTSKLVYFSGYVFRIVREPEYFTNILCMRSCTVCAAPVIKSIRVQQDTAYSAVVVNVSPSMPISFYDPFWVKNDIGTGIHMIIHYI